MLVSRNHPRDSTSYVFTWQKTRVLEPALANWIHLFVFYLGNTAITSMSTMLAAIVTWCDPTA